MHGTPPARWLLVVALATACQAPPLPEATTEISTASTVADWSAFTIGPNDRIHVGVFAQPEFSSPLDGVRVGPDGAVGVPLLGPVHVAGLSASEAGALIQERLEQYLQEPYVTVSVLEQSSRRFYVFGEVRDPGPVAMDRPITALEALSLGGGSIPGARLDPVVIVRPIGTEDIEVIPFNAQTPGPDGLVQVLPDDIVFVSKSGVGVFREEVFPYLQGAGLTVGQIASVLIAYDRIEGN